LHPRRVLDEADVDRRACEDSTRLRGDKLRNHLHASLRAVTPDEHRD
jgi:hypothetical protein